MPNRRFSKVNLAWFQLIRERRRMIIAILGIACASILIFLQLGLLDALYDGAAVAYRNFRGDLAIVSPKFQTRFFAQEFSRKRLIQASAIEDIEAIYPVYIGNALWRNPESLFTRSILTWGIDPNESPFSLPEVTQSLDQLKSLDRVIFDRASRPEFGAISTSLKESEIVEVVINEQTTYVVGLFELGASFGADGNIIISDTTFLKLFPTRYSDRIDIGLIKLRPNSDIKSVKSTLIQTLPDDVKVLTIEDLAQVEIDFWKSQGIGFIFTLGAAVGVMVGITIVYQILYADISDHMQEYATLKAMGYTNKYLNIVLIQESLILAVLSYIPSFILSFALYSITQSATKIPIEMKFGRAMLVFVLTLIMCITSCAIASRKLYSADPADIF